MFINNRFFEIIFRNFCIISFLTNNFIIDKTCIQYHCNVSLFRCLISINKQRLLIYSFVVLTSNMSTPCEYCYDIYIQENPLRNKNSYFLFFIECFSKFLKDSLKRYNLMLFFICCSLLFEDVLFNSY